MTSKPPGSEHGSGNRPSPEHLAAYHDGEASPDLRGEVEDWLAAHPEEAQALAGWRSYDQALRKRLEPVVSEAVPAGLTVLLKPRRAVLYARIAAAAALLVLSASSGWFARGAFDPGRFPDEALRAHAIYAVEKRHPVEVGATEAAHLESWLTKRTGVPIVVPSLERHGYALMGGRLLSSSAGPAALIMFENGQENRISLIVVRTGDKKSGGAITVNNDRGAGLFWQDKGATYALVGAPDDALLRMLGESVAAQTDGI